MYQKRKEWLEIQKLVDESGLLTVLGPFVGFATDGDPRCRGLMVEDMYLPNVQRTLSVPPPVGSPDHDGIYVAIHHPTFVFCARLHTWSNGLRLLTSAHMQDYLHSESAVL